jgi:hypothetical protein
LCSRRKGAFHNPESGTLRVFGNDTSAQESSDPGSGLVLLGNHNESHLESKSSDNRFRLTHNQKQRFADVMNRVVRKKRESHLVHLEAFVSRNVIGAIQAHAFGEWRVNHSNHSAPWNLRPQTHPVPAFGGRRRKQTVIRVKKWIPEPFLFAGH